ncbi:hypothetical protein ACWCPQ_09685 [Nocardia sp. NPDC001965]
MARAVGSYEPATSSYERRGVEIADVGDSHGIGVDIDRDGGDCVDVFQFLGDESCEGEFDAELSVDWLVAVAVQLAHAAAEASRGGRTGEADATHALRTGLLRVLGCPD